MGKSPVRQDAALSPIPLNSMHTTTGDFFRWDVVKMTHMVPRDAISFSSDSFVESGPNPFPINGSFTYGQHAFFCPSRLVWKDWKFYYTELQSGLTEPYFTLADLWTVFNDTSVSTLAQDADLRAHGMKYVSNMDRISAVYRFLHESSLSDIPQEWQVFKLSAIPLRACNRIWFDWMRDKLHISDNALSSYCLDTGGHISLQELELLCSPRWRNYPKNIFTSCFDNPQDGAAASAPGNLPSVSENPGMVPPVSGQTAIYANTTGSVGISTSGPANGNDVISSTSINQIRWNNSIQQYRERLLVAGKTVISRCLALLGVSPTIEELQMSNWLGGKDFDLKPQSQSASASAANSQQSWSSVGSFGYPPQTATVLGQKSASIVSPEGMGLSNISYRTDETGYFVVMGAITPNVQYYQGLSKNWTAGLDTFRSDKFDFFHSDMENQPFDPILFYEICCSPLIKPKNVFGFGFMYQRYKEDYDSLGGDYVMPQGATIRDLMSLGRDVEDLVDNVATDSSLDPNVVLTPALLRQASLYDLRQYDGKFTIMQSSVDHFNVNHKFKINALRPMQLFCLPSLDSSLSAQTPKDVIDTGGFTV